MREGGLQTLRRSMYCTHDLNMLKLLYRRCAILTSSSNPPKWTLQLLWDCVFCVVGGFPFASSPSSSFLFLLLIGNPINNKNKEKHKRGEEEKGKPPTTQSRKQQERVFVMCSSIYRFMSWAHCQKSPTLIRKCFEKRPHSAQHVFYISA